MGTLKLTGRSEMKIAPEMTVVTMSITGITKDYQKSIRENAERLNELKDIIESNGIEKDCVKTYDFWIREDWSYNYDSDEYKRKFNGYKYHQTLQFKFPNDNMILSKITYATSDLKDKPNMDVAFITEREKEYEEQLLAEAVKDAMSKANAMVCAGGFKIIGIESINAPYDDYNHYRSRPRNYYDDNYYSRDVFYSKKTGPTIDLEPEDFIVSKYVDIIWYIE